MSASRERSAGGHFLFVLRALNHRNYRLFFCGQGLSLLGTWMQHLALGWLVFKLTGDEFKLGLVGFAAQLPNMVLAPMAGVFADRWDRRRILIATQALSMLQAAVLAAMVLSGFVRGPGDVWYLIGMSLMLGLINSVDIPVRQSFVVEMVGSREDLAAAIPLNSLLFNLTRFVGPSLAGLVVYWWGEGFCFLFNSASYLAVIAALLAMRLAPRERRAERRRFLHELREGVSYAWGTPHIRLVLFFLATVSLVGIPYMVLMPAFAKDVFHGDSKTQGFLMGAVGLGAICGTLLLASQRSPVGLGRIMATGTLVFGVGLAAFALCGLSWDWLAPRLWGRPAVELPPNLVLWLAGPVLAAVGFGQVSQLVAGNTLLQMVVDEDKRGRVMSLHTVAFLGTMPLGSLLAGTVAHHHLLGPTWTVLAGGLACLVAAAFFSARLRALRSVLEAAGRPTAG
jgi:MFS family permease